MARRVKLIVGYLSPDVDVCQLRDAVKDGFDKAVEFTDCKNMVFYG